MRLPNVDLAGCDVFLWREEEEIYVLILDSGKIGRMRDGSLAAFITNFPRDLTLCILNDETGQAVRIPPIAN